MMAAYLVAVHRVGMGWDDARTVGITIAVGLGLFLASRLNIDAVWKGAIVALCWAVAGAYLIATLVPWSRALFDLSRPTWSRSCSASQGPVSASRSRRWRCGWSRRPARGRERIRGLEAFRRGQAAPTHVLEDERECRGRAAVRARRRRSGRRRAAGRRRRPRSSVALAAMPSGVASARQSRPQRDHSHGA